SKEAGSAGDDGLRRRLHSRARARPAARRGRGHRHRPAGDVVHRRSVDSRRDPLSPAQAGAQVVAGASELAESAAATATRSTALDPVAARYRWDFIAYGGALALGGLVLLAIALTRARGWPLVVGDFG